MNAGRLFPLSLRGGACVTSVGSVLVWWTSGGVGAWRRERTGRLVVGGGGLVARRVGDDADGWLLGDVADVCERDARGWT